MDGFGSSEFAVIVVREDGTPQGSIGKGWEGVAIYHADTVTECATAVFDETGALANFDDAVGELVNTTGGGAFGGYYNDPDATNERMRHGMYWSGDLAYRDADGWIYLAGRTADWMRVDGENLAAAPIERILLRLPTDQPGRRLRGAGRTGGRSGDGGVGAQRRRGSDAGRVRKRFLSEQQDLSPKAWPRFVRINAALPQTATNKILKRELIKAGVTAGRGSAVGTARPGALLRGRLGRVSAIATCVRLAAVSAGGGTHVARGDRLLPAVVHLPVLDAVDHA